MIRPASSYAILYESDLAFLRELPVLLRDYEGHWAAYHGMQRVGLARTKSEVYAECRRQGLPDEEFLVRCIEPPVDELIIGPVPNW